MPTDPVMVAGLSFEDGPQPCFSLVGYIVTRDITLAQLIQGALAEGIEQILVPADDVAMLPLMLISSN